MGVATYIEIIQFKQQLQSWLSAQFERLEPSLYVVFFSYGQREERCKVWSTCAESANVAIKRSCKFIDQYFEKNRSLPEFLKFDVVSRFEKKDWSLVVTEIEQQPHNNHFRQGLSFDEKFEICFLEQEVYGKAIIRGLVYNQPNFVDAANLNHAIKSKYPLHKQKIDLQSVWVFDTVAAFYEHAKFIELHSTGPFNGVRKIEGDKKQHIREIVLNNAHFLHQQILTTGQFNYGYFAAYARPLKGYNTVRHCTSLYALLEALEVDASLNLLAKIRLGIEYAIEHFYKVVNAQAFMIDSSGESFEIKLGANAAAIFMFAKYQEITQDSAYQHHAEMLAAGILSMVDAQGETTHVLHYPSLEEKEKFRIVYYDGEAALGLLRLYQINHKPELLSTVKRMFENFIDKKYDKYHDHWLSYCSNELTKIEPHEKYFQFGIHNYLRHMKFIRERKTAYATFLEMMMSAYKMLLRLKQHAQHDLYQSANFEELKQLIEYRVEYQLTGFFYPEVAMYTAHPAKVLHAFYVRHDRFRVRIDDQEHNLSGFIAYLNHFEINQN